MNSEGKIFLLSAVIELKTGEIAGTLLVSKSVAIVGCHFGLRFSIRVFLGRFFAFAS